MRMSAFALFLLAASPALAAPDHQGIAKRAAETFIIPGYQRLHEAAAALASGAAACEPERTIALYHDAFDAWMGVSHLAFGPVEAEGRVLAIAYWPDKKGFTPRALRGLIDAENPVVDDPAAFADVSVAARGFFALDHLLFDPGMAAAGDAAYRCRLTVAIGRDLERISAEILDEWRGGYGDLLANAGAPDNLAYLSPEEASQALYKTELAGLKMTLDLRLDRPLGTFDRPAPRRAEAWRSGRSTRNIRLSLAAVNDMYEQVFAPALTEAEDAPIRAAFAYALAAAARAPEPLDEAVADPLRRVRLEALRGALVALSDRLGSGLGGALGVGRGFNAMDGD
ncbi:MAG: imelysin family protein [Pikeienuella sp.]